MRIRRLIAATAGAALFAASAVAAPARFDVTTHLVTSGCKSSFSGGVVTVGGCVAHGSFSGTARGRIDYTWAGKLVLAKGTGAENGRIVLHGAKAGDLLTLTYSGMLELKTGQSHGSWRRVAAQGTFAEGAPAAGTYLGSSPDQGAHVALELRG